MENQIYVDVESALRLIRGNKKLYHRMLGMFLASEDYLALEESLAAGDNERSAHLAHSIKGVTGNLSMTPLFEVSMQLMLELRQGSADAATIEKYRQVLVATQDQVRIVMADLEAEGFA